MARRASKASKAKKITKDDYDKLKKDYTRVVRGFDTLLLYNGRLIDSLESCIDSLLLSGVDKDVLEDSGLIEVSKRPKYSQMLKDADKEG